MRRVCRPGRASSRSRESDYGGVRLVPRGAASSTGWLEVYVQVGAANDAEPDAGRRLLSWARAAGFADVIAGVEHLVLRDAPTDRAWWGGLWADRIVESDLARQAVERGFATAAELDAIAAGWRRWAEHGRRLVQRPARRDPGPRPERPPQTWTPDLVAEPRTGEQLELVAGPEAARVVVVGRPVVAEQPHRLVRRGDHLRAVRRLDRRGTTQPARGPTDRPAPPSPGRACRPSGRWCCSSGGLHVGGDGRVELAQPGPLLVAVRPLLDGVAQVVQLDAAVVGARSTRRPARGRARRATSAAAGRRARPPSRRG